MTTKLAKFVKNKETKNTVRYSETEGIAGMMMKEVYIQKAVFEGEAPNEIEISINY